MANDKCIEPRGGSFVKLDTISKMKRPRQGMLIGLNK